MQKVKDSIGKHKLIDKDDKILIAVSGGIDSMALAHWMHSEGFRIGIAHINYQLRGVDSNLDEELVTAFSKSWNIPFHILKASMPENVNTQEWARNERYAFFNSLLDSEGYTKIATAHHLDDQAETVFMNLLRGTGIKGMGGIPRRRGEIVRPLLDITRAEIEDYIKENKVPYRSDSSNSKLDYTRNQIRHKLMPLLDEIGNDSRLKLHRSLKLLEQDKLAINALSKSIVRATPNGFRVNLDSIPEEVRHIWLYHAMHEFNFNRTQCADLLRGSNGAIVESDTHKAALQGMRVVIHDRDLEPISILINETGSHSSDGSYLILTQTAFSSEDLPKSPSKIWLDASTLQWPLNWATVKREDQFKPIGSDYKCNVLKYLKDRGIDRLSRSRIMVLKDSTDRVVCLPGIQVSQYNRCRDTTKSVISVELL
mgnify:FL=1